jgi:hypothetical protein
MNTNTHRPQKGTYERRSREGRAPAHALDVPVAIMRKDRGRRMHTCANAGICTCEVTFAAPPGRCTGSCRCPPSWCARYLAHARARNPQPATATFTRALPWVEFAYRKHQISKNRMSIACLGQTAPCSVGNHSSRPHMCGRAAQVCGEHIELHAGRQFSALYWIAYG